MYPEDVLSSPPGHFDKNSWSLMVLKTQMKAVASDRDSDAGCEKIPLVHMLPDKSEDAKDLPTFVKYCRVKTSTPCSSQYLLATEPRPHAKLRYASRKRAYSPRPLVMIATKMLVIREAPWQLCLYEGLRDLTEHLSSCRQHIRSSTFEEITCKRHTHEQRKIGCAILRSRAHELHYRFASAIVHDNR